jgi:hypothetical protein
MPHTRNILLAAFAAATLTGCVVAPPPPPPIPAPLAETRPLPPVSAVPLIWQPGHWDYVRGSYRWAPGEYVPRAGHGAYWQPGYWTLNPQTGTYGWVPAHWT